MRTSAHFRRKGVLAGGPQTGASAAKLGGERERATHVGRRWNALLAMLGLAFLVLTLCSGEAFSADARAALRPDAPVLAPPQLAAWKDWVLYKSEYLFCPPSITDPNHHICSFPARLTLQTSKSEAVFSLRWRLYDRGRALLPYAKGLWPEQVRVNGKEAPVTEADGVPTLVLGPGEYEIAGKLVWSDPPEFLQLPAEAGLVQLVKDGAIEPFPDLSPEGKLVLAAREAEASPEDSLDVTVFRKLRDSIPVEISTHLRLEVAGKARRISLPKVLPAQGTPLAITSPIPLRFQPDGGLEAQAGPGRWDIEVVTRLEGPISSLGPLHTPFGREFWSFQAESELRVVEISGPPAVDPQTTSMPSGWKRLPAYMVDEGATLKLQEMHRGAADSSADVLQLNRTLWLDYNGRGLTVRDQISGTVRQAWTLTMPKPAALGRVTLDGKDESILLLGPNAIPGVELRKASLNLRAESRYENFSGALSCSSWDRDFQSVKAELNLPPGWRLLTAQGVDAVSDSWINHWTLWDIFFTLIVALAMAKVAGPLAGLWALLFLGLAQHEMGSPQYVWLFLLASLGLARAFDSGGRLAEWIKTRRAAQALYALALLCMLLASAPFILKQIRLGVYPQLAQSSYSPPMSVGAGRAGSATTGLNALSDAVKMSEPMPEAFAPELAEPPLQPEVYARRASPSAPPKAKSAYAPPPPAKEEKARQLMMYDPEALVQTGPGLPAWQWRRVTLTWNGPVARGEELRLYLLSPAMNLALALARVLFLCLALRPLVDFKRLKTSFIQKTALPAALSGLLFCGLGLSLFSGPALAQEFPPEALLNAYRERLTEPAACFPNCASSPKLEAQLDGQKLRLIFYAHLSASAVIPLPVVSDRWQPREVLLDEQPAQIYREDGALWLHAPEGAHRIIMEGPAPRGLSFQIALPLAAKRATIVAPGWTAQGVAADGRVEGAIRLARTQKQEPDGKSPEPGETYRIPPFLHIERTLTLGLTWEVETTVRRVTPLGEPVVLEAPLLEGESVLTESAQVKDGRIRLNMAPSESSTSWRSRLEPRAELTLSAPRDVPWVETWTLSASSIWDVEVQGAPVVRRVNAQNVWAPVWRPWPGEKALIKTSRPKAAPGASMTIDEVSLASKAGARLDEHKLTFKLRASKGGRLTLRIPAESETLSFRSQEREFPKVGDKPGELTFQVSPGLQTIETSWRQPSAGQTLLKAPEVRLPLPAVNATLTLDPPKDRWILLAWGGPLQGPAVLYWSYLGGMLLLAFALGYLPWTPLKRWQWLVLGLGLSQADLASAGLAVAWLAALGLRREHFPKHGWFWFNVIQLGLIGLTLFGFAGLYDAVRHGLLGHPEMQIRGNGSTWTHLIWGQDRVADALPQPSVLTAPIWMYRALMLAWSLWLAWSLLRWTRWGWDCFTQGGLFRRPEKSFKFSARRKERDPAAKAEDKSGQPAQAEAVAPAALAENQAPKPE